MGDAYVDEISSTTELKKFAFKAVQVGSVVEYEYVLTTNLWTIPDWYFQDDIPIIHNEYQVSIPEYFTFKQLETGYFPLTSRKTERRNTSYESLRYYEDVQTLIAKDVPAFITEDYTNCPKNYTTCMRFELARFIPPNGIIKNYTATWESINKQLLDDSDFGSKLNGAGFLKDQLQQLKDQNDTPEKQMAAIFAFVQNHLSWDKKKSIYSKLGAKTWEKNGGSSGDINLFLTAALLRAGFDANPVILSTRENGIIHPAITMVDQFNYVISSVKINDKLYLLDATEKYTTPGILPSRCLNEKGRLINKTGGEWITIEPLINKDITVQTNINIATDGTATGTLIEKHNGYAAMNFRNDLAYYTSTDDYVTNYQKELGVTALTADSITGVNDNSQPIIASYNVEFEQAAEKAGELLLIKPVMLYNTTQNPFKLEERNYPVDFTYPSIYTYIGTYQLPDGYAPEELPKPQRVSLPDKGGSLLFSAQNNNGKLTIMVRFIISKPRFLYTEYLQLKQFYNLLVDFENKPIVLKKI